MNARQNCVHMHVCAHTWFGSVSIAKILKLYAKSMISCEIRVTEGQLLRLDCLPCLHGENLFSHIQSELVV